MKKIVKLVVYFITLSVLSQSSITKNIGDFSTLKVYNGIDLVLIKSDEQKLEIKGEKASKVKIKAVNNTLKISLNFSLVPNNNYADGEVEVKLYYKNPINVIDANEGAIITASDFSQDIVEIKAQERAFINMVVTANFLNVKATSGGIVKLTGKAKNQEVSSDLYGTYHGFDMHVSGASTVKAGTGAKAEIYTDELLSAKVSFGGSIFYKGDPKVVNDKKVVGGIIQKRN